MEAVKEKDGWLVWNGYTDACPALPEAWIEIRLRNGEEEAGRADSFIWGHGLEDADIVAWRYAQTAPTCPPAPVGLLDAIAPNPHGWHKWNGLGWCPAGFHGHEEVEVRRRNGDVSTGQAWVFSWRHGVCKPEADIVEWRPIAPASITKTAEPRNVNAAPTLAEQVDHPAHYNQGGIECIDAIRAALTPEEFRGFCKGNALKYIWRERHKGGAESLEKAAWYMKEAEK